MSDLFQPHLLMHLGWHTCQWMIEAICIHTHSIQSHCWKYTPNAIITNNHYSTSDEPKLTSQLVRGELRNTRAIDAMFRDEVQL